MALYPAISRRSALQDKIKPKCSQLPSAQFQKVETGSQKMDNLNIVHSLKTEILPNLLEIEKEIHWLISSLKDLGEEVNFKSLDLKEDISEKDFLDEENNENKNNCFKNCLNEVFNQTKNPVSNQKDADITVQKNEILCNSKKDNRMKDSEKEILKTLNLNTFNDNILLTDYSSSNNITKQNDTSKLNSMNPTVYYTEDKKIKYDNLDFNSIKIKPLHSKKLKPNTSNVNIKRKSLSKEESTILRWQINLLKEINILRKMMRRIRKWRNGTRLVEEKLLNRINYLLLNAKDRFCYLQLERIHEDLQFDSEANKKSSRELLWTNLQIIIKECVKAGKRLHEIGEIKNVFYRFQNPERYLLDLNKCNSMKFDADGMYSYSSASTLKLNTSFDFKQFSGLFLNPGKIDHLQIINELLKTVTKVTRIIDALKNDHHITLDKSSIFSKTVGTDVEYSATFSINNCKHKKRVTFKDCIETISECANNSSSNEIIRSNSLNCCHNDISLLTHHCKLLQSWLECQETFQLTDYYIIKETVTQIEENHLDENTDLSSKAFFIPNADILVIMKDIFSDEEDEDLDKTLENGYQENKLNENDEEGMMNDICEDNSKKKSENSYFSISLVTHNLKSEQDIFNNLQVQLLKNSTTLENDDSEENNDFTNLLIEERLV